MAMLSQFLFVLKLWQILLDTITHAEHCCHTLWVLSYPLVTELKTQFKTVMDMWKLNADESLLQGLTQEWFLCTWPDIHIEISGGLKFLDMCICILGSIHRSVGSVLTFFKFPFIIFPALPVTSPLSLVPNTFRELLTHSKSLICLGTCKFYRC